MCRDEEIIRADGLTALPERVANLAVMRRRIHAEGQNLKIAPKCL